MANTTVPVQGTASVTVPASGKIATNGAQQYQVIQLVGYPNEPSQPLVLFSGTGRYTSSAFTSGASISVQAGASTVDYNVGASAAIVPQTYQTTPGTLNATGTLTAALILGGIVTSTSAAAVAATLDTGTVMDAAVTMAVDDSFVWSLINTGPNTVTVTASTGHTIVGTATVATVVSGRFRTRKTAANTFVTYREA
jgi:hypothetical protein